MARRKKASKPSLLTLKLPRQFPLFQCLLSQLILFLVLFSISRPSVIEILAVWSGCTPELPLGHPASAGLCLLLLELTVIFAVCVFPKRYRTLKFFGLESTTYRRHHVSQMRLDRLRRQIQADELVRKWKEQQSRMERPLDSYYTAFIKLIRSFFNFRKRCHPSCHFCDPTFRPIRITGGGGKQHSAESVPVDRLEDPGVASSDKNLVIDIEDFSEFDMTAFKSEEWIGKGIRWSDSLPSSVKAAFSFATQVPSWAMAVFVPPDSMSVNDMLEAYVPLQPDTTPRLSSSHHPPNVFLVPDLRDPDTTLQAHVALFRGKPLLSAIDNLNLRQAWLSGHRSFSLGDGSCRYPLWVANLVKEISFYCTARSQWERSVAWLNAVSSDDMEPIEAVDVADSCRDRLSVVPWRGFVPGSNNRVHMHVRDLAGFLGDTWLDDEMINCGAEWVMKCPGVSDRRVGIINCHLLPKIMHAKRNGGTYVPSTTIETHITHGSLNTILVPTHVFGNHWTLTRLEIDTWTYSYADCYHGNTSPPDDVLEALHWWMRILRPNRPRLSQVPFSFTLPIQLDGYSCGVVVLGLILHLLVGAPLWQSSHTSIHRMEWFLRLSEQADSMTNSNIGGDNDGGDGDGDGEDSIYKESTQDNPDVSPSPPPPPSSPPPSLPPASESSASQPPGNTSTGRKRPRTPTGDASDTGGDESDSREGRRLAVKRGAAGQSSTWASQKKRRDLAKQGKELPVAGRLRNFQSKILSQDPKAEFKNNNPLAVRCSACSEWLTMRALNDIHKWIKHRGTAKCQKNRRSGLSTRSLVALGFTFSPAVSRTDQLGGTRPFPCPGLAREGDPRIDRYMSRTSASGGGAPSRARISKQLFNGSDTPWSDLTPKQRHQVLRKEELLHSWTISRTTDSIYSTKCEQTVHSSPTTTPQPCSECQSLYNNKRFYAAIHRPMPDEENMKFVPKVYRSKDLSNIYLKYAGVRQLVEKDDGRSPWLKFALGVVSGEFVSETLLGMVKALVVKADRVMKGKSLRNMKYSNAFDSFCNRLAAVSPRAYKDFRHHFGGRGMNSIRSIRAKMPRFRPGFSDENFDLLTGVLEKYKYAGPLCLSWDDTELEPAISIYQESKDVCVVIGGTDGDLRVQSEAEIERVFEAARLKEATKLRLWLLTIPLLRIPPIFVAIVARGGNDDADRLFEMHNMVADRLHARDVHPVSLASDGTEVERQLQDRIVKAAPSYFEYSIPCASAGSRGILNLRIPLYLGKHPFVTIQDSKHALKTARNQLLTGARILVLSFFTAFYAQLRQLALHPDGPLFVRDIERVDRQDDRAAARTFSAAALKFQISEGPDQRGLTVYLFILGELVDAWQNRNIGHLTRAKMVMRARFFLMAWRAFIVLHPDYSVNTHFISRESFDIFMTLAESFLTLLIIYRKFYHRYPLLPWLHSTEPCEHVFGVMRQIKKDFTFGDALSMQPKLQALLMGDFNNLSPEDQANRTAGGYHHTYFDSGNFDPEALSRYPSDDELSKASDAAFLEAKQLLQSLGIDAKAMLDTYSTPGRTYRTTQVAPDAVGPQTLAQVLAFYAMPIATSAQENEREACELALVADSVARSEAIESLPNTDENNYNDVQAEIESQIPVDINFEPRRDAQDTDHLALSLIGDDSALKTDVLVATRLRHEPQFVSRAVRQRGHMLVAMNQRTRTRFENEGPTLREALLSRLSALGTRVNSSTTAGVNRQVRHAKTFTAPTGGTTQVEDKLTARLSVASKYIADRERAFNFLRGVHENYHSANILSFNPLRPSHFVVALSPTKNKSDAKVILGEVITMYSKGMAKTSKHEWISETTNLGLLSYVYIRMFTPIAGTTMFTSVSCPALSSSTFVQVPRNNIIHSLASSASHITTMAIPLPNGLPSVLVTLDVQSSTLFNNFSGQRDAIFDAVKLLSKSHRKQSASATATVSIIPSTVDEDEIDESDEDVGGLDFSA